MTDVVIAQKAPYAIEVEAGKVIFGALAVERQPTLLRWCPPRH